MDIRSSVKRQWLQFWPETVFSDPAVSICTLLLCSASSTPHVRNMQPSSDNLTRNYFSSSLSEEAINSWSREWSISSCNQGNATVFLSMICESLSSFSMGVCLRPVTTYLFHARHTTHSAVQRHLLGINLYVSNSLIAQVELSLIVLVT